MSRISTPWALASSVLLLSSIAPAFAAEDEDIVVTGRFPVAKSASSVSVITAQDIERYQTTSVFDTLRGVPGVTAAQTGGPGQTATIRLRGASSGQTLVLIDGAPVNDATTTSGYNFAYLDSGVVERIEVLRGAGSAIWGSDALGGVINVITYEPGKTAAKAYAEGGSFRTGRMGARASYAFGPLTLSGYATGFNTDGVSAANEKDGNPEKDGSHSTTLGGRASFAFGDGFVAQLGYRLTEGQADFDDGYTFATGIADSAAEAHSRESLGDVQLGWRNERFGVDAAYSRSLTKNLSEGSFGDFRSRSERTQYRLSGDAKFGATQIALIGVERSELESETTYAALGAVETDAAFATYSGKVFDKLLLEGGVRYEDSDQYGSVTTGRLGAAYDVWSGGVIRAMIGNAFRAPSINELSGGGFKLPNPNLEPEKSREWEIGVEQRLFDDAAILAIVYFDRDIKNQISGAGSPFYRNIDRVESTGVETSLSGSVGAFDLSAAYIYNRARDLTLNEQLQHVPEHTAYFDATWNASDALSFGGRVTWNDEENDTNFGPFTPVVVESWTVIGLRTAYKVSDQVELYGRVDNVTDEQYEDIFSYGTLGRSAYAGIRVKM